VGLDNDFATWRASENDYWPSKYLIDRSARIRYEHYGEGAYQNSTAKTLRASLNLGLSA